MDSETQTIQTTPPRTIYLCEPQNSTFSTAKRVFALTFSYDENGNIQYGASIYRRTDSGKDVFHKKGIRMTSMDRFERFPVRVKMTEFNVDNFSVYYPTKQTPHVEYIRKNQNLPRFENVVKTIRKAMFKHGVSAERQSVKTAERQSVKTAEGQSVKTAEGQFVKTGDAC
jgi:hypothetical protein